MSKKPAQISQPKGRITIGTMAEVIGHIEGLDMAGKTKLCDELAASQPEALGWVVLLPRQGVSMATVDDVLHLLLVISESVEKTIHQPLRRITEEDFERAAVKVHAMFRLLEGESKQEAARLSHLMAEAHPEQNLFAYVAHYLGHISKASERPGDERAVFATAVLLEVFLQAAGLVPQRASAEPPSANRR